MEEEIGGGKKKRRKGGQMALKMRSHTPCVTLLLIIEIQFL